MTSHPFFPLLVEMSLKSHQNLSHDLRVTKGQKRPFTRHALVESGIWSHVSWVLKSVGFHYISHQKDPGARKKRKKICIFIVTIFIVGVPIIESHQIHVIKKSQKLHKNMINQLQCFDR